ncbi:MAG: hypothetical protein ACI9DO_000615 [Reinekea sp.]|jgi:hypothetical protein
MRCTYGAIADELGLKPNFIAAQLGERRPYVSWVVNSKTNEPTDYSDDEKHPNLYRTSLIIKSADALKRYMLS